MAHRKKLQKSRMKDDLMTVPQFGGWVDKKTATPDYSMVFSRARENRKYQMSATSRTASVGNESDLLIRGNRRHHQKPGPRASSLGNDTDLLNYRRYDDDDEPIRLKKRKKVLRYLCCIMV